MTPQRVSQYELAKLWNLGEERVRQYRKEGRITRGSDGKFDLQDCLAFRKAAISDNEAQALFQSYYTPAGLHPPKIFDLIDDITDEECLGIEPAQVSAKEVFAEKVSSGFSRLQDVRIEKERMLLERQKRRDLIESGKLIERDEVYKTSREAAADIVSALNGLEYEIAALFSDHETKKDVRGKVHKIVDKVIFSLHKKFDRMARPLDGPADDI